MSIYSTVYDLCDAESYYEECTTINELKSMLEDGKHSEAKEYTEKREKEHGFNIEDHLFHEKIKEFDRELILDEKFVQEKLLPEIRHFESMSCQSRLIYNAITNLAVIKNILENNKRAIHWEYMNMKLGGKARHYGFTPVVLEVDIELKKPYIIDATDPKIKENGARQYNAEIAEARRKKYDGVIFKNSTLDGHKRTEYMVFSHEQINEHGKKKKLSDYAITNKEK